MMNITFDVNNVKYKYKKNPIIWWDNVLSIKLDFFLRPDDVGCMSVLSL